MPNMLLVIHTTMFYTQVMKITTKQMITILATLGMITVNALANILPFNGVTTAEVSNRLNNYFVPAGYVFSIWGIIYIALLED